MIGSRRFAGLATAALMVLAACGSSSTPAPSGAASSPNAPAGSIQITGAGATFPFPLYSQWFYQYAFVDPSVKFNYQSIGSGGGIQQITQKTVDFGASDAILTQDQLTAAPSLQMFPSVAGGDVAVYNVAELQGKAPLVLDGPTLANIFLGKITNWNDPAIAALNSGLALPDKPITVIHRSDGSGTTFIFTDYLSNVSPDWKSTVGNSTSVQWPVGLGGKGNEGVSGTLAQTDGSIGYVELAYATQNKLSVASLINAAGKTVTASIDSVSAAMADFGGQMPATLARSIVNAPGATSWPISGYTYLLVYLNPTDCAKATKIAQFITWALGTDGSKYATSLQYVPLPDAVHQQDLAKLKTITCNGQPLSL